MSQQTLLSHMPALFMSQTQTAKHKSAVLVSAFFVTFIGQFLTHHTINRLKNCCEPIFHSISIDSSSVGTPH